MTKPLRLLCYLIAFCPFINQAQIQFSPYIAKPTGSWPDVVAIGDINNDGLNDVVIGTLDYVSSNDFKILVFRQNANGTLASYTGYSYLPSNGTLTTIDIADVNQDNRKDVIIGFNGKIGIFYQNTSGGLNAITSIITSGSVTSLKCADFNNDSKTDIAVAYESNDYISIYYQTTAAHFTPQNYLIPGIASFMEMEIGDVNNDSKKDIVCISNFPAGTYTFIQNATNGFNNAVYNNTQGMSGFDIGDLNNDGKNDIAFSKGGNVPYSKIGMLYQNTTSQLFDIPTELDVYDSPEPVEIADLNNDGKSEIISLHGGSKACVYKQNSSNVFGSYSLFDLPYATHYNVQGMAVGDINHDGKKDIAIADYNNGLILLYNSSTLDVNENDIKANIVIYPNPITNYLSIENKKNLELSYEISDINGKIVQKDILNSNILIDVSQLQAGFYFLTLKNGQEKAIYKLIKN